MIEQWVKIPPLSDYKNWNTFLWRIGYGFAKMFDGSVMIMTFGLLSVSAANFASLQLARARMKNQQVTDLTK